jgi:hypothetical protein
MYDCDTKYVWHCANRHKEDCRKYHPYRCNGDSCKNYRANPGSINDKTLRKVSK